MNQKDPCTFFDQWLTAYSDHLHMVRQGISLASSKETKLPLAAAKNDSMIIQKPKSSGA